LHLAGIIRHILGLPLDQSLLCPFVNMRDSLLGNMVEEPATFRRATRSLLPRLRGGNGEVQALATAVGAALVVIFFGLSMIITSVSPLEYGIKKNMISGVVYNEHVQGGLHGVMPWQSYITFPATRVTLEWSNSYLTRDKPQVMTRTGADPNDPDSGGQPLSVSCAVQIRLISTQLRNIYLSFGSYDAAKQRYLLLAGNVVSNTAQDFTPQDFWQNRQEIASRMLRKINETLVKNSAEAVAFQIMKVDFAPTFEQSITGVQVAEQQKVVNEYSQQVQQVEQQINVLFSHNNAQIATIHANAVRKAKEMVGNATKQAFIVKQDAKADMYKKLQDELEFSPTQMAEYIKIRSLVSLSQSGKVVVNVPSPEVGQVTSASAARHEL